MALTPYEPTTWVNDSEPDLDATNLNKVEQGIKDAIDGVNGILAALTNQLSTDPDKYAGIAVVNQLNTVLNDLSDTVDTLNSNLTDLDNTVDSISTDVANIKPVTSRTAIFVTDGTDYDTLSQPGWYYIYSTVHAPASNLGRILVRVESIYVNGNWYTTQKAVELYSGGAIQPKVYERWVTNINGTFSWTSWIQTV